MGRSAKLRRLARQFRQNSVSDPEYGTWSPEYLQQCQVLRRHPETDKPIVLFHMGEKRMHFDPDVFSPEAIEFAIQETFMDGVERGTIDPAKWI